MTIDPYETERKLLAISSPCGGPLRHRGRRSQRAEMPVPHPIQRQLEELAQLLARECPLRELLAAVRETEGET